MKWTPPVKEYLLHLFIVNSNMTAQQVYQLINDDPNRPADMEIPETMIAVSRFMQRTREKFTNPSPTKRKNGATSGNDGDADDAEATTPGETPKKKRATKSKAVKATAEDVEDADGSGQEATPTKAKKATKARTPRKKAIKKEPVKEEASADDEDAMSGVDAAESPVPEEEQIV